VTTIAYKDGLIAYDSRMTEGNIIIYNDYNKHTEVDGVHFFFTGADAEYQDLINAYFGRAFAPGIDAGAIVVDGGNIFSCGVVSRDEFYKAPLEKEKPYALGSGSPYAYTAMDMGAPAGKAVEMAKKRDTRTGGEVRVFSINGARSK